MSIDRLYVFQPARIIFPDTYGDYGPICVEVTPPDGGIPIRKFLHPIQLRNVPTYPQNHWEIENSLSVVEYCRLLQKKTALLEPGQYAENIDLQYLMRALSDIPWMKVVRIWIDKTCVQCVYTKIKLGFLSNSHLSDLVWRSSRCCDNARPALLFYDNTDSSGIHCTSLGMMPYELQECVLQEIQDVHSVVSAQRVCMAWYDILTSRRRNRHVAIDLAILASNSPNDGEYSRSHLLNILDNIVTPATVSLTLMNGNLSPDFGLYVRRFLSLKVARLPMIALKNVRCMLVPKTYEEKRLQQANLGYWRQACQVLHLRDVTISTVYMADMWPNDDVFVEKAVMHCTPRKAVRH
ncbi:uncharacterized protein LOC129596758 [Paramacrobiotus metropolitanus]|uniref:uncharacterized protein LOC129596758 n=1 Tax=Paramacrobiotus metropolitanus TaxID=2943436 RepID=UPI002445735F|nr:uncharacterized protein LOC129596758 [Paramacrobiotus metropolitanus]